jgi:hypothetical protein
LSDYYRGYYLSQIAAGQTRNSPAFNAGSEPASNLGMDKYTTRKDGVKDTGKVDIGFHYVDHRALPMYRLNAMVTDGHGWVEPASGSYYAGMLVTITAVPEMGYRVAGWTGTLDDTSKARTNSVIMTSDRDVTVWFDQPRTIVVGSDPNYTSIQHAVDAAVDGDIVIVPTGTYIPAYNFGIIEIRNKGITLTSANPDDPRVVAATVLSGYVFYISTPNSETVIDGITIQYGNMLIVSSSPAIRNCVFADCRWWGMDGGNPTVRPDDGQNGVSVEGGAITMYNSSPTVLNCVFTGCTVTGGDGGRGDDGAPGFDGGWAGWAYGGAVYCGFNSSPTFVDCSFANC